MHSSRKSPGVSALSEMFKAKSQTDMDSSSVEDGDGNDHKVNDSGVKPVTVHEGIISQPTERTALLSKKQAYSPNEVHTNGSAHDLESQKQKSGTRVHKQWGGSFATIGRRLRFATTMVFRPKTWNSKAVWKQALLEPASLIPPVILGLLLNILDALSYGRSDVLPAMGLLTASRYDPISTGSASLCRSWCGWNLHVLRELHSVSTRVFLRS